MNKLLAIIVAGGLLAFGAAMNYHFILLDDDIRVLKKIDLTLDKTFIDARGAKKLKLVLDPSLVRAGVKELIRDAGK
ncbi:MAG: hypothetical protein JXI32_09220 [Deltaproteobacteria bacterium]|nr:hypothetical protein [Deltaproteobacteria bacterium]